VESGDLPEAPDNPPVGQDRPILSIQDMVESFRHRAGDATAQRIDQIRHLVSDYRTKLADRLHWGPFGFLVRDVALSAPSPHRNYCANPPEIVEDIFVAYEYRLGRDLVATYLTATQPCLVKFYQVHPAGRVLDIAAHYLCTIARGFPLHGDLNTNLDGQGRAVPPERILEVQVNPVQ
jgi:hypothetical protein